MLDPYFAAEGIVPKDGTGIEPGPSTPRSELPLGQVVSCLASRGPRARDAPSQGVMGAAPWEIEQNITKYMQGLWNRPQSLRPQLRLYPRALCLLHRRESWREGQTEAGRLQ